MKTTPLPRKTTADRIAAVLLQDMASGLFVPGARLDEVTLARRFSASRTPVREALGRLAAQNVLTTEAGRGARVPNFTKEQLAGMFEAMQELETICAKLASYRLTLLSQGKILAAQKACEQAAQNGDRQTFLQANETFHMTIYQATQNPFMVELASNFRQRTGPARARRYQTAPDFLTSIDMHQTLVQTILNPMANKNFTALKQHMATTYMDMLDASDQPLTTG